METEIVQHQSERQRSMWSVAQISFASYIAGPVGGCYFLGRNYKELENFNLSRKCYVIGIVSTIFLYTILFMIPQDLMDRVPHMIIPIVYSTFISSFAHAYQKKSIQEKLGEGNRKHSCVWCFLVVLSILVIQIPLIFLYFFLFSLLS